LALECGLRVYFEAPSTIHDALVVSKVQTYHIRVIGGLCRLAISALVNVLLGLFEVSFPPLDILHFIDAVAKRMK
jgi:hypothetical protein